MLDLLINGTFLLQLLYELRDFKRIILYMCVLSCCSRVQHYMMLWTIACQVPLSMGVSRQEDWGGLPYLPPEDLPTQGSNLSLLSLLHWQAGSLPLVPAGKHNSTVTEFKKSSMAPYYLVLESQVHIPQVAMQDLPRSDHSLTSKPYTHISTNAQAT